MPRSAVLTPEGSVEIRHFESRSLSSGEVRVAVSRSGVNYWEIMQRHGRVPLTGDRVPGTEGAGAIVEVGEGVTELGVGDRVAWSKVPGSYTEELVASEGALHRVPDSMDDDTAAGILFQGVTAQYLSADAWPLQPGDSAIVTAAAGGVGLILTQLLRRRGVEVLALVSAKSKAGVASRAGAAHVLTYDGATADALAGLAPDGVAAVFDGVGGELALDLMRQALRPRGAMVLYGSASGTEAPISAGDLGAGSWYLTRTAGRDYNRTPDETRARSEAVLELGADETLKVLVGSHFSLDQVAQAWGQMESRSTVGKLLICPLSR